MTLIVLSNRGPGSDADLKASGKPAGGLVSALLPLLRETKGTWISEAQTSPTSRARTGIRCIGVPISREEAGAYYRRVSNEVLWPAFHCFPGRMRLLDAPFAVYAAVNDRFARAAELAAKPGDSVWVHDFHLCLVPGLLRRSIPNRIGWFCHIPFPPPEIFGLFPWRRRLLEGLLGADVIGFHLPEYAEAFVACVRRYVGAEAVLGADRLRFGGRTIRVGGYPIGIAVDEVQTLAQSPAVDAQVKKLRSRGRRMLLGVDRLDYTKGLVERVLAVERLLERRPGWRGRIQLLQIVVPSRAEVSGYASLRSELQETIGRISGRFGTPDWNPIRFLFRSYPLHKLVAFYRAADVVLVTALRDGMNLVAKEFVAAKVEGRKDTTPPGMLVLSEFAGAARELADALIVNPYDLDGVAAAIHQALSMAPAECHERLARMRASIRRNPVSRWGRRFVEDLEKARRRRGTARGRTA